MELREPWIFIAPSFQPEHRKAIYGNLFKYFAFWEYTGNEMGLNWEQIQREKFKYMGMKWELFGNIMGLIETKGVFCRREKRVWD